MEFWTVIDNLLVWNLTDDVNRIHTETTNSLVNPEVHHIIDFLTELWIFPVEIWLSLTKDMKVILA